MNRLLADILKFLNGAVAIVLILLGGMVGAQMGRVVEGFFVGACGAVLICGFVALLIDIRSLLVELRDEAQIQQRSKLVDIRNMLAELRDK